MECDDQVVSVIDGLQTSLTHATAEYELHPHLLVCPGKLPHIGSSCHDVGAIVDTRRISSTSSPSAASSLTLEALNRRKSFTVALEYEHPSLSPPRDERKLPPFKTALNPYENLKTPNAGIDLTSEERHLEEKARKDLNHSGAVSRTFSFKTSLDPYEKLKTPNALTPDLDSKLYTEEEIAARQIKKAGLPDVFSHPKSARKPSLSRGKTLPSVIFHQSPVETGSNADNNSSSGSPSSEVIL